MDLGLTEEQEILRRSARDFLEAECPTALVRDMESSENDVPEALWGKMASLGWMGIINRNQYDGNEGSYTDLAVLLEEMGRFLVPGPFFNSVVETAPLLN
ncbi:MAG: acyl-CoA dehydrogenase family protein, partial [Dehalococcoidia bacterium]